jgi:hypothetical protein
MHVVKVVCFDPRYSGAMNVALFVAPHMETGDRIIRTYKDGEPFTYEIWRGIE